MNYLVTGGAGFIGSHIAAYLCKVGNVRVLDNFSSGKRENIEGLSVSVTEGDIRDPKCVAAAMKDIDTVFHQAADCSVTKSMTDPITTMDVNVTGTLNLLDAARKAECSRFVMASSSAVYGDADTFPKDEEMPANPLSPYAVSKLICEFYCQLYWRTYGLETVALRYFNVFGPRQDPHSVYSAVIPRFMQAMADGKSPHIYGDGHQTRDFTYIDDVVQANMAAASSSDARGQIMNIACGKRFSLLELLDHLETLMQRQAKLVFENARPGDVKHSQASITKAQRLIGYSPEVSLEDGLRRTLEWLNVQHHAPQLRVAV